MGEDENISSEVTQEDKTKVQEVPELPQAPTDIQIKSEQESAETSTPLEDNEGLKTEEEKDAEIETLVQDANVIIHEYFDVATGRVKDLDSAIAEVGRSGSSLGDALEKVTGTLRELEDRRMRGERCDLIIEDLHQLKRRLENAKETVIHDHVIRGAKDFSNIVHGDESSWKNRGGTEAFLTGLREAALLEDPSAKSAALGALKEQIEVLGGKTSFDAKNLAVATDLFVREVGEELLRGVSLGFDIDSNVSRLPEAGRMRRSLNDAMEQAQHTQRHLGEILRDTPSDYYAIARAGERLMYEMEGVLMAAEHLGGDKTERNNPQDNNSSSGNL